MSLTVIVLACAGERTIQSVLTAWLATIIIQQMSVSSEAIFVPDEDS
jgi:hypothetical protein